MSSLLCKYVREVYRRRFGLLRYADLPKRRSSAAPVVHWLLIPLQQPSLTNLVGLQTEPPLQYGILTHQDYLGRFTVVIEIFDTTCVLQGRSIYSRSAVTTSSILLVVSLERATLWWVSGTCWFCNYIIITGPDGPNRLRDHRQLLTFISLSTIASRLHSQR